MAYVGQARNLRNRYFARRHHAIMDGDTVSWLLFPEAELNWAEAFYIGVLRPARNFNNAFAVKWDSGVLEKKRVRLHPLPLRLHDLRRRQQT